MKINIEIDMTPEEARTVLGMPDIAPMQEELMKQLTDQIRRNVAYIDPELIVKTMVPVGAESLDRFQRLIWNVAQRAVGEGDAPAAKGAGGKTAGKTARKRSK